MNNEATASDYIKQVTESGSAFERVTLLATSVAHWAYGNEQVSKPLTEEEHNALVRSFRTPAEQSLFEKYKAIDDNLRLMVLQLSAFLQEYDHLVSSITNLTHIRIMLQLNFPAFANDIGEAIASRFGHEAQVDIFREVSKRPVSVFNSKAEVEVFTDENGDARAEFSFPGYKLPKNLEEVEHRLKDRDYFVTSLTTFGQRLTTSRRLSKALIKVLSDVMTANRFRLKPYVHYLKQAEKKLRQDPIVNNLADINSKQVRQELGTKLSRQLNRWHEETRRLFWSTYDEIEITDADRNLFIGVFKNNGIAYERRR